MAFNTDGNGNYYCGQFSSQINYSYNTSDLNINTSAGTLRTDLTNIFGLLNYRFFNFSGVWANGTGLSTQSIDWKTANDPILTLVRRFTLSDVGGFYDDINNIRLAGWFTLSGSHHSYIINQYGIIVIKHNITNFTTPSFAVSVLTELIDVNSTIPLNSSVPYYSGFYENKLLLLTPTDGRHYVKQTNTIDKAILLTGDAVYGITCNDGQTAGTDLWMTKLHVFDSTLRSNGVTTKCSRIGTVPNMAIGIGTSWVIGRIYQPATNLFPGNNNKWLCVGRWNNLSNRFILVNVWSN